MNQVQILPVDMPVGFENKGVDTNVGKDASKSGDDFGAILAKHNVDSEESGKSGKSEKIDGNNSPEEKVDSSSTPDAKNAKHDASEKEDVLTDTKRFVSDAENKDGEAAVITIPSEKELKSEQAKDVLLEVEEDTSLKTSDDVFTLFGKKIEREAMPAKVDDSPEELVRKTENTTKSNNDVLADSAQNTEDKANKLLSMLDEIKGISTEHVKVSDKNIALENTAKPVILELQSEHQNAVELGKQAQKANEGLLPSQEPVLDTKQILAADKTAIAKAVEQNIESNNIARSSVVNEEVGASEEAKASVAQNPSIVASENITAKPELNTTEEIESVDESTVEQTGENTKPKSKVNADSEVVNTKAEISANENKERNVADVSVAAAQNNNVKAESTKEISEARTDSTKQAQMDSAASVGASNQGNNANQENGDNKQQAKQQPVEADKVVAEQKLANSANEQVKPELETAKVERAASPAASVATPHTASSVASAQAFVDKLTMEANPVTNVKQQTAVAEVISINRPDFSNAVKEKVMVMVNQKIRQLDIRLDPPELGSMQIKVNMQNEQAVVSFMVQNQSAKEAVEQQLSRFKEMMSESGVDVGEANVSQQQEKDQGELADHQKEGQHSANAQDSNEDDLAVNPAQLYKASSTGVDYFV